MLRYWEKLKVAKGRPRIRVVVDEAHCLESWRVFREDYGQLRQLQHRLPERTTWYLTSATLPPPARERLCSILGLRENRTVSIIRSNDRPNIYYVVKQMEHTLISKKDLTFLVPPNVTGETPPPPKFIAFFRSRREAEEGLQKLRAIVGETWRAKIRLVHAGLTQGYRERSVKKADEGEIWGITATVAASMVSTGIATSTKNTQPSVGCGYEGDYTGPPVSPAR